MNLPQNWKTLIKEVEVLSLVGGGKADISSSNNRLFLLSHAKIGLNTSIPYTKNEVDADEIIFSVYTDINSMQNILLMDKI